MPFPIERKFVVAISSSALFDAGESGRIFDTEGPEAYRAFQEAHLHEPMEPGVAFPFIRRILRLNDLFPDEHPVEVVILSRNFPETGLRVFNSIKAHGLDITRAAFCGNRAPYEFLAPFNATLFLSANEQDVRDAVARGLPAGLVIQSHCEDDSDVQLRLAFDFDAVLADDESERVYKSSGSLDTFNQHEVDKHEVPLNPGPLKEFLTKIAYFQKMEAKRFKQDPVYEKILTTSIVTARSAPAHERVINTLKGWGISVDSVFFLGGIEKKRILEALKPHLFFDDQIAHLNSTTIPQVHIPFGVANGSC